MPSTARALALGLLASLGACAPFAAPRAATVTIAASTPARASAAPAGPEALIWTIGEDGKITTHRLAPAATGYREVAAAPALYIAAGDDVWRWTTHEEKLPTVPCTETNGMPAGEGLGTRAVVERLPGADPVVVTKPPRGEGNNDVQHSVVPVGSIGPYLFVRESTYMYSCGAHGNTAVSMTVWDLTARRAADILTPSETHLVDTSVREEARRLLAEATPDEPPEDISHVADLPRYGAHGFLHVDHAFTTFACYACGDGEWSSYTRSTNATVSWLPERVRSYAHPPAAVSAYLDEHHDVTLAGWSELTPAAARALEQSLAAR